jgi:hypothetical protein
MRNTGWYFDTLTCNELEPSSTDLQHGVTLQDVKKLPSFGMKVSTLAVPWRHTLLDYAQLRPIEQMPPLAWRAPLIAFRARNVDDAKQGVSQILHRLDAPLSPH